MEILKKSYRLLFPVMAMLLAGGCQKKITQNDISGFKVTVPAISEGNTTHEVNITVTPKGDLVTSFDAQYEIREGTALFQQDINPASGTLSFSPQQPDQEISLTVIGDTFPEITEYVTLQLTYENNTITQDIAITDDDPVEPVLSDTAGYYTALDHPSMELVWHDEFEDTALNTNDWSYELGDGCDNGICGWGNNELETYTNNKENVRLENGRLVITALEGSTYTSGRIITKDKTEVTFGRIDVRAKLPKGQGLWPAIWMLGANVDDVSWPACGEIDIMELVGNEPAVVHGTAHYDDGGYKSSTGSTTLSQGDFSDQFHVFTLIWDRNSIAWYLDNKPFKTFQKTGTGNYPFNAPFFFIMNVAVGGNWPGDPDETTVFPQSMTVDYIRVYQ